MPTPDARPLDAARWNRLQHHCADDPSSGFQPVASSRGRPWRGLGVWLQRGPLEDLYVPASRMHCILVRRGPTARLLHRQDGEAAECRWRTGEAIVLPAGTPSFWRSDTPRDNLHINLDPAWLARVAGNEAGPPTALRGHAVHDDAVLRHFAELLLASLSSNASLCPGFADGIALALAAHLLEHHARREPAARRTAALTRRQLDAVAQAVHADLGEPWSIERLAALLALSPFHFSRAFKSATGETPHRYVMRLRMEHARRLVLDSAQPLIDIAVDAGFASLSHFGQAFRRQWGTSPSRLRRAA